MNEKAQNICRLFQQQISANQNPAAIGLDLATAAVLTDENKLPISDRIAVSNYVLKLLTRKQRIRLAQNLIEEQFIQQQRMMNYWNTLTAHSSFMDACCLVQPLVSLQTQTAGMGIPEKQNLLSDGSLIKAANFLDCPGQIKTASAKWNFPANTIDMMEQFFKYNFIYLVSIDCNPCGNYRIRIWKVNPRRHEILNDRYLLWMNQSGYPKFTGTSRKPYVNFQLFPPTPGTDGNFARHGNGRNNQFPRLRIPLENTPGASLIFKAEIKNNETIISTF